LSERISVQGSRAWVGLRSPLDWDEDEPEFPEEDGPVFAVGGCALVDAAWAAVGEDPLRDVLGVLVPVLDDAVPGLDGQVTADALIGAFATEYRCELPGDAEVLERIKGYDGDALRNLAAAGAVRPADVLPVGLAMLSALAHLCRSDSASVLHRVAGQAQELVVHKSYDAVHWQGGRRRLPWPQAHRSGSATWPGPAWRHAPLARA
jgi:hypothetical protein